MTGRGVVAGAVLTAVVGLSGVGCGQQGASGGAPSVPGAPASSHAPYASQSPSVSPSPGVSGSAEVPGSKAPGPGSTGGALPPVYFSVSDAVPGAVHEVVRDRAALDTLLVRIRGRDADAARAIDARTRSTDFTRSSVVMWADVTGCSAARSVVLQVSGAQMELTVTRPDPPQECFAPHRMTAVFEVPRARVPDRPVFRLIGHA